MNHELAELLRRRRAGRPFRDFAEQFKLSHTTLQKLEKGMVTNPEYETLRLLAEGLDMQTSELVQQVEQLTRIRQQRGTYIVDGEAITDRDERRFLKEQIELFRIKKQRDKARAVPVAQKKKASTEASESMTR